jgi:hypothetical protein
MFAASIECQLKKKSSTNLMAIKVRELHLSEDLKKVFPHEASLEFMVSTGWLSMVKLA